MPNYNLNIIVSAKDQASGALGKIRGSLGGLGKAAAGVGLGVGVAGVAVGGAFAKMALDAAPLEGIQKSFEGVTKSFEGGSGAMLAAMKKGSKGMITNRDLMTSFNKAAQLVSKDFAQKLPDAMGHLGKVSAATGQDMDYMMDSLVTGIGRLSPMILDNLGIQVSLTEANEVYAASIGKSAGELTKAEQQTALMNQVMEKLATNTADMPDITDNASTKMAQLGTMFSDVKDRIGVALLPILTKLMEKVIAFADQYLPPLLDAFEKKFVPILVNQVVPAIAAVFEWIGKNLPKALQTAKEIWESALRPALEQLAAIIQDPVIPFIEKLVSWLQKNIPKAFQAVQDVWNSILKPVLTALWNFIQDPLIPIIEKLVEWLNENIPEAYETVREFWESTLKPALTEFWSFVQDNLIPIIEDVYGWLKDNIPEAFGIIKAQWEKILKPALEAIWKFIKDNIIPIVKTMFEWLGEKIPEAFKTIKRFWDDTLEPVLQFMLEKIGSLVGFFEKLIAKIKEVIDWLAKIKVPDISLPSLPDLNPFSSGSSAGGGSSSFGGTESVGATTIIMYGTTFEGIQDTRPFLEALQELAV